MILTDRERYLVSRIRKALGVKGNPVRTSAILMEALQNLPSPPAGEGGGSFKTGALDEAFGVSSRPAPEPVRTPFGEYVRSRPGVEVVGLTVLSANQPGTVYSIAAEEDPVAGVRLFSLRVVKSKGGAAGTVFHGVPETMLLVQEP